MTSSPATGAGTPPIGCTTSRVASHSSLSLSSDCSASHAYPTPWLQAVAKSSSSPPHGGRSPPLPGAAAAAAAGPATGLAPTGVGAAAACFASHAAFASPPPSPPTGSTPCGGPRSCGVGGGGTNAGAGRLRAVGSPPLASTVPLGRPSAREGTGMGSASADGSPGRGAARYPFSAAGGGGTTGAAAAGGSTEATLEPGAATSCVMVRVRLGLG